MAIEITYYVHSTTRDNEQGIATGWLPGKLSAKGLAEASLLGEIVSSKTFDMVFCSDLKRAVTSAVIAFRDIKIILDSRLRECNYGDYNGKPANLFKDDMAKYIDKAFPNGESYKDVEARIADFVEFLKKNHDNKRIAVVAHQAPQLALDVVLKGKTWQEAIAEDWRKQKAWQAGWEYVIN